MAKILIHKLLIPSLVLSLILVTGFSKLQDNGMSVKEYFQKVQSKDSAVFVYFNADWCVPCIKLKPVISELEKENPSVKFLKLNVDENPQVALYLEINTLPLFFIYKNTKQVWSNNTYLDKKNLQDKITLYH